MRAPGTPRWVALLIVGCLAQEPEQIGFCLDQADAPPFDLLDYAGVSQHTTETSCNATGGSWCPLSNDTRTWRTKDGGAHRYYFYSPCCTPRSSYYEGKPTCAENLPSSLCAYHHWAQKLTTDLLATAYDLSIAPGTPEEWYRKEEYQCICKPQDPNCERRTPDGKQCVICNTPASCGPDEVTVGVHFFKVHTIDLRTSELALSIWLRQEWYDRRLSYHSQCYGDLKSIAVQAKSGSLEESRIWTPDLELYNSETPMWGGFTERLATIYSCAPTEEDPEANCGYVFWSTPGILKALCKFRGLAAFPYDTLSCDLELASWATDGRIQDIKLNAKDGGVAWVDDPEREGAMGGMTAGSNYQDYTIKAITARRVVTTYDGEPGRPWPTLLYSISFSRSGGWYERTLVYPMIALALLSFITFWISPQMGERLVFGITVVLALLTHDIVVTSMMPICAEMTYLNYLSIVCQGFAEFALFETAVVLWVYHQEVDTWSKALIPKVIRERTLMKRIPHLTRGSVIEKDTLKMKMKMRTSYQATKNAQIRDQLYRMMFIEMDKDYTGFIEPEELIFFGSFIMGSRFRLIKDLAFWRNADGGGDDLHVNFEDFVTFCETKIDGVDDTEFLKFTCENFLKVSQRRTLLIGESWQDTANAIDSFSRFGVPFAFFVFLMTLNGTSLERLTEIEEATTPQTMLLVTPFWPMFIVFLVCLSLRLFMVQKMAGMKRKVGGAGADVGSGWFRSYSIEQDAFHCDDVPRPDDGPTEAEFSEAADARAAESNRPKPAKVGKPKKHANAATGAKGKPDDFSDMNF